MMYLIKAKEVCVKMKMKWFNCGREREVDLLLVSPVIECLAIILFKVEDGGTIDGRYVIGYSNAEDLSSTEEGRLPDYYWGSYIPYGGASDVVEEVAFQRATIVFATRYRNMCSRLLQEEEGGE